jgi:NADH-quinone oxidoreductase subunit H
VIDFLNAHADLIITLVKIALLVFIVLTVNAYLTWFERKLVAHIQSRWGPHRVGPHGLLQPAADGLKFLFKEDPTPAGVDKFVYYLAPLLALTLSLTSLAVIPFGPDPIHLFGRDIYLSITPPELNIGLLVLFAITALGVYGVALAGWSSNSKYPLLGGLRSSASFKFAMFFIAEYTSMITVSCLCTIMFFGGWLSPFPASWHFMHYLPSVMLIPFGIWVMWDGIRYETIWGRLVLPGIGTVIALIGIALLAFPAVNEYIQAPFWFLAKVFVFLFVYVWMRGTLPRLRYDQLMSFGWKFLLPVSIVNVIVTSFVILLRSGWK